MTGWLNSPGHRANIENASYRAIGIGVARSSNGSYYWTQDFGTLADGGSTSPPPPPPPPPAVKRPTVDLHADAAQPAEPGAVRVDDDERADERHVRPRRSRRHAVRLAAVDLGPARGAHTFAVTAANSAGSSTAKFTWSA